MLNKILDIIFGILNIKVKKNRIIEIHTNSRYEHVQNFVHDFSGYCIVAGEKYNIPGEVLLAQIAGETGWGKKITKGYDENKNYVSSNNLFNIKCGNNWTGDYVFRKKVKEYIDNKEKYIPDSFRKYDSFQDSVDDYCKLIISLGRYSECKNWNGDICKYLNGLKIGGYATDPKYIDKLKNILQMFNVIYG